MNTPDQLPTLVPDRVIEKIKNDGISMYSRGYYRLRMAALIAVIVAIVVVSVFLLSFISFGLRTTGNSTLLGFGTRGYISFILVFPWILFVIDILLIIILERLLRNFRFVYRRAGVYILIGLVGVITFFAVAIDHVTSLHNKLLKRADANQLPLFNELYEHLREPLDTDHGVCRCFVLSAQGSTIMVQGDSDSVHQGDPFPAVLPPHAPSFFPGQHVFMLGAIRDGTFYIEHIQIVR